MQAPLGLAVIGGLVMSTFATLLVLPSIFAVVIGRKVARSPSIYPDDPESSHYDPQVFADEEPDRHRASRARTASRPRPRPAGLETDGRAEDDVLAFLRRILDEARSKRHDMVTHYTVDDLRAALGFAKPGSDLGTLRRAVHLGSIAHRGRVRCRWRPCAGAESDTPAHAPPYPETL